MIVDEKFQRMVSDRSNRPRTTWANHTELKDLLEKHPMTNKWDAKVIEDVVNHETFINTQGRVDMKWAPATLSWSERENDYLDLELILKQISIPILFIIGGDRLDDFKKAFELEKVLPNMKTVIVSNTGHNMYMERPDDVAEVIRKFQNSSIIPERI